MSLVNVSSTPNADLLAEVTAHVRAGGLVILPTDTVYGIGALASAPSVAKLLAAKGRDLRMPPPVLVADGAQLDALVAGVPAPAKKLLAQFWPGALTVVLDAKPEYVPITADATLAVRMPDHPLALELLRRTGPLAVTSANRTGQAPATDAASAQQAFPGLVRLAGSGTLAQGDKILLLYGGATPGPLPSTIISFAGALAQKPRILRQGALPAAELAAVLAPLPLEVV